MLQQLKILLADNVMSLIHKHKLVSRWIELENPIAGHDALNRSNSYIGGSRGLVVGHFDIYMLVWVCIGAVAGSLFYQLATVGENKCLRGIPNSGNSVDEMCEDNLEW